MPKCNSCGKKGLFLKIEEDTGLCLACNEKFASEGKILTEKIIDAKRIASVSKDSASVAQQWEKIVKHGSELIQLHQQFNLAPSQELLDLIETYKEMSDKVTNEH